MIKCENCFWYKSGECNGVAKECNDYRMIPQILENEKKYWRKEGDASRYRRQFHLKDSGGYSIQIVRNGKVWY